LLLYLVCQALCCFAYGRAGSDEHGITWFRPRTVRNARMTNLPWQFVRLEHGIRLGSDSRYDLLWRTQSTGRVRSLQVTFGNQAGTGRPDPLWYQSSWSM
jgi:hypothetical protein